MIEGHAGDAAWRVAHGIPLGRTPTVEVRNSHVSYIVTWYARCTTPTLEHTNITQVFSFRVHGRHVYSASAEAATSSGSSSTLMYAVSENRITHKIDAIIPKHPEYR